MGSIRCAHCGRVVVANPRIRNQTHCNREECRQERRRRWQREKMASDPDYRANQRDCQKAWRDRNPHYSKEYRKSHPEAADGNRLAQRERNKRRIAKMDSSDPVSHVIPGDYYLVPEAVLERGVIAKMDSSALKISLILMPCKHPPHPA
jgi:hypothetical protein